MAGRTVAEARAAWLAVRDPATPMTGRRRADRSEGPAPRSSRATGSAPAEGIVAEIAEAPAPFRMRPHWGKVSPMDAATISTRDERHGDFVRLQERLDPPGGFRNQWLRSRVLGNA